MTLPILSRALCSPSTVWPCARLASRR